MINKKQLIIGLLLSFSFGLNIQAQQWPTVTTEMKPASRWWWMGSAVDEKNLTFNMEEYAKAGLGGLEITPIYGVQGNDKNEIDYLSPRWMNMLKYTQKEGKRLGIEIDMNNGTGWPFGGPQVTIDHAATKAIFQTYLIKGGKSVTLDISVKDEKQRSYATLSRLMAYSDNGKCINLTTLVQTFTAQKQILHWNSPTGNWKLIALYNGKTRQMVKRAAPGGEGYVMDHLSKEAVAEYLTRFDEAFRSSQTACPHTFFNDSYEVFKADWTPDFLTQFAKRRGYKLEDHFHEFLDESRPEVSRRIVSDYRETISDLLLENFTCQWTRWAHQHGSITRNQAHGSPANLIDLYAAVDIPECEGFGLSQFHIKGLRQDSLTRKNYSDLSTLKYASSAAHITGKTYTSSETFTWLTEHFRASFSQCKPDLDLMFVSGVNHVFFHGTPYSPKEASWPGWQFYASIDMSPTNSIWHDAPSFFKYITRCQSFLQKGKPNNDFLIYLPVYDMWNKQPGRLLQFEISTMNLLAPKFIKAALKIDSCGYDGDYISDRLILSTRFTNGQLTTIGGTNYKAIVIPGAQLMPKDVLAHLLKLAQKGATVIFLDNYPKDVPGYSNLTQRRAADQKILKMLPHVSTTLPTQTFDKVTSTPIGKGQIITGSDYFQTLSISNIPHEEMKTKFNLSIIRRQDKDGYHYFISSLQARSIDSWVTLATKAKSAIFFDPVTGESGKACLRQKEDKTQIYIQLHSGESIILQTYRNDLQKENCLSTIHPWEYLKEKAYSINLDSGWKLNFKKSWPTINSTFNINQLCPWTDIDNDTTKVNMGTGTYSIDINLPTIAADDWILDLGDVRESARVRVNEKSAGYVWSVPYCLKIGKLLKQGMNHIEFDVTNLAANRIADLDRHHVNWRKFKEINMVDLNYKKSYYGNWQIVPSGLNSSVKLIPADNYIPE